MMNIEFNGSTVVLSLLSIVLVYLITHITVVKRDENAQEEWFGKPIGGPKGPGWYLRRPLATFIRVPSGAIPIRIPGTNEEIQKENQDNIQPGKVAPIRIVHADPKNALFFDDTAKRFKKYSDFTEEQQKELKVGSLNRQLTSEVTAFVLGRIDKDFIWEFHRYSGSIEEAIASLKDVTESSLQNDLALVTPDTANRHMKIFSYRLLVALESHTLERPANSLKPLIDFDYEEMQRDLARIEAEGVSKKKAPPQSWGFVIDKSEIKNIDPGYTVNKANSEAAAAVSKREETILNAQAEAQATETKGIAEGKADEARGKGRAAAIKVWGAALQEPGAKEAAILETTEKVAAATNTLILAQNPLDLVTAALTKQLSPASK